MTFEEFRELEKKLSDASEEYSFRYGDDLIEKQIIKNTFTAGYRTALMEIKKLNLHKVKMEVNEEKLRTLSEYILNWKYGNWSGNTPGGNGKTLYISDIIMTLEGIFKKEFESLDIVPRVNKEEK